MIMQEDGGNNDTRGTNMVPWRASSVGIHIKKTEKL